MSIVASQGRRRAHVRYASIASRLGHADAVYRKIIPEEFASDYIHRNYSSLDEKTIGLSCQTETFSQLLARTTQHTNDTLISAIIMAREWWMDDRQFWRDHTSPHLSRQGNWQGMNSDDYSTMIDVGPLHSYGTWTQYGLFPCVQPSAFSAAQQAQMLQQADAGGMLMDFSDCGGPMGSWRGSAGDIGVPGWLGWQFYDG